MKTSLDAPVTLVDTPSQYDPQYLLDALETDPEAFTTGRRNDDVVNWFLAKRMVENNTPGGLDVYPLRRYTEAFRILELTVDQDRSVYDEWKLDHMTPELKVTRLYQAYGRITDNESLASLWIPSLLRVPNPMTDPMF